MTATRRPGWMIDELAMAGHEHLDPGYVPTYDAKAQTDPAEDLAILRAAGLGPERTLLDLGAGTGTFAIAAAAECRHVTAVDVSALMLRELERKIAGTDLADRVTVAKAGFLTYAHQGEPVDVIYTRHALHHLPDFWKAVALTRMAAWLRPGGTLLLRDLVYRFEPQEVETVLEGWLQGAAPSSDRGWTRAELEEHIREEYSPFSWALEAMLDHAGFDIVANHVPDSRIYAAYECRKRA